MKTQDISKKNEQQCCIW